VIFPGKIIGTYQVGRSPLWTPLEPTDGGSTRTRTIVVDGWWGWNPVSGPVNSYHVPFKAIENLRTLPSPEEHLALTLAVTGMKTNTLLHGSFHQPCLSQLLIPSLPHR